MPTLSLSLFLFPFLALSSNEETKNLKLVTARQPNGRGSDFRDSSQQCTGVFGGAKGVKTMKLDVCTRAAKEKDIRAPENESIRADVGGPSTADKRDS